MDIVTWIKVTKYSLREKSILLYNLYIITCDISFLELELRAITRTPFLDSPKYILFFVLSNTCDKTKQSIVEAGN